MSDEQGYNGWTNYETWAVALWLDNEEPAYHQACELVEREDPDGEVSHRSADALKSWLEDEMPDLGATVWADLLRAAFSEVDWLEIAEHHVESGKGGTKMAAGIFPPAGELFCEGGCDHSDCAAGRRVWRARWCRRCGLEVEPGQRHYGWPIYSTDRTGDLVHALCAELEAEHSRGE